MSLCSIASCGLKTLKKGLCNKHYKRQYYAANRARLAEISRGRMTDRRKTFSAVFKAETSAYQRKYRNENAARLKLAHAAYAAANNDRRRAKRAENAERINEQRRLRYPSIRDAWRNYESMRKAKKKGAEGRFTHEEVKRLFVLQDGKCTVCRCALGKVYHRDHIVPIALGGSNSIHNIQLLCVSCNTSKQHKHPVDFMQSRGFLL